MNSRASSKKSTSKKKAVKKPSRVKKWSAHVMQTSDALDLEKDVFKGSAQQIASSLKRSSEKSHRRKGTPFQSAMSMLNFYINRGGKNLSESRKATLEAAKKKLRILFGRKAENKTSSSHA